MKETGKRLHFHKYDWHLDFNEIEFNAAIEHSYHKAFLLSALIHRVRCVSHHQYSGQVLFPYLGYFKHFCLSRRIGVFCKSVSVQHPNGNQNRAYSSDGNKYMASIPWENIVRVKKSSSFYSNFDVYHLTETPQPIRISLLNGILECWQSGIRGIITFVCRDKSIAAPLEALVESFYCLVRSNGLKK